MYAANGTKRAAPLAASYDYGYFGYSSYHPPAAPQSLASTTSARVRAAPGMSEFGGLSDAAVASGVPATKKTKPGIGALLEMCNQVNEVARRRRELETELMQVKQLELQLVGQLHTMAGTYDGQTTEEVQGILSHALGERPQPADISKHFHIYVGNLPPTMDDQMLTRLLSNCGTVSSASIIREADTYLSKGFGFCSFPTKEEAENAIGRMNGQWYMGKSLRLNWASRKPNGTGRLEYTEGVPIPAVVKLSEEEIAAQTDENNSTVYVGGLPIATSETELCEVFGQHGTIASSRVLNRENFSFAFIRYSTKDEAVKAIHAMHGEPYNGGLPIKVSWGKPFEQVQAQAQSQAALYQGGKEWQ